MDANIIIVGGGCAGMQLIHGLLQLPYEQTGDILVIEKHTKQPEKSWCFWTKNSTEYDSLISKKWSKIQFSSKQIHLVEKIHPYSYNYIKSDDFFDYHNQLIANTPRITRIYDEVTQLISEPGCTRVVTKSHQFTATRVYDSRIDFEAMPANVGILWQHFRGYFIQTETDIFDPDTATMMDFSIDQSDAAHFMYVLPFSKNVALVEFTAFSKASSYPDTTYDSYLKTYISTKYTADYQILSIETGKIPMTDFDFKSDLGKNVFAIGSAAGAVKPTTGYAFNRIRKDTRDLIANLKYNENGRRGVFRKLRFRFYDKLLLKIIRDEPQRVRQVMEKLFKNNSLKNILDFLDEESNVLQEIAIFSKLPIRLFLKQVLKYVFAR